MTTKQPMRRGDLATDAGGSAICGDLSDEELGYRVFRRAGRYVVFPLLIFGLIYWLTSSLGDYGSVIWMTIAVNICIVCGLHLLVQWGGQVALGQAAVVGVGAFTTGTLNGHGWALPLAVVGGMVAGGVFSGIVGLPALRIRGFELAIVTLAAAFAASSWLFRQSWVGGDSSVLPLKDSSFLGRDVFEPSELTFPLLVVAAVVVAVTAWIGSRAFGRGLRIVAADENVAASYGVNVGLHKFLAFVFAGACGGLGGSLFMVSHPAGISANDFRPEFSTVYLAAVIIGGAGSVLGSAVMGGVLAAYPILAGSTLGTGTSLVSGVAMVCVLLLMPRGLNGLALRMWAAVANVAMRRKPLTRGDVTQATRQPTVAVSPSGDPRE
jgi:branched-chain amino acid transport system permease protein